MKRSKKLEDPTAHFKLSKKAEGVLEKQDLSEVVNVAPKRQKPKTFTLRLSVEELQDLQGIVAEVNQYSQYKKISANDVIRALIAAGKKMDSEKVLKALKEL